MMTNQKKPPMSFSISYEELEEVMRNQEARIAQYELERAEERKKLVKLKVQMTISDAKKV